MVLFGFRQLLLIWIVSRHILADGGNPNEEAKTLDVYEGSHFDLGCKSDATVSDCLWFRSDYKLSISGRYQYKSGSGHNTKDCSISIFNSESKYDTGVWTCLTTHYKLLQVFSLTVYPSVSFVQEPSDLTLNVKENSKLDCVLNVSISECLWKRNGHSVWIDKRYQYLNGNGKNTSICSIVIFNARSIDNGTWQCAIHGKIEAIRIFSREAKVIVKPVSFVKEPDNLIVNVGHNDGKLDCLLNLPVSKCQWKRNGVDVPIDGRYQFLVGNGLDTAVGSVIISEVQFDDNGTWQCEIRDNETKSTLLSRKANIIVKPDETSVSVEGDVFDGQIVIITSFIVATLVLALVFAILFYTFVFNNKLEKTKEGSVESVFDHSESSSNGLLLEKEQQGSSDSSLSTDKSSRFEQKNVYKRNYASLIDFVDDLPIHKTIQWNIQNYRTKKHDAGKIIFVSQIYRICSRGCRIQFQMKVDQKRTYLDTSMRSIWLSFMFQPNPIGIIGNHIFEHEISYMLKDLKRDVIISQTKEPGYGKVQQDRWKSDWAGNRMFATAEVVERVIKCLQTDNLQIEIHIKDFIPLLDDATSHNGVLDWKIHDYSLKKKNEKEGMFESLVSEPFYTSQKGYRMRAELYLNGSLRHGTHMELQLRTFRGKYDSALPRAFAHVRKVTIMPVDYDREPIFRTDTIDPSEMGEDEVELEMGESRTALLVPVSEVENGHYIRDDTLHIKIEITPLVIV